GRWRHESLVTSLYPKDASMLPRLIGWAKIACACSPLWLVPSTVAAQEGQRSTVAGREAATLSPFLTLPERPSPQAGVTLPYTDQSTLGSFNTWLDAVGWNWARLFATV